MCGQKIVGRMFGGVENKIPRKAESDARDDVVVRKSKHAL